MRNPLPMAMIIRAARAGLPPQAIPAMIERAQARADRERELAESNHLRALLERLGRHFTR